jgi:hypothetical protein
MTISNYEERLKMDCTLPIARGTTVNYAEGFRNLEVTGYTLVAFCFENGIFLVKFRRDHCW